MMSSDPKRQVSPHRMADQVSLGKTAPLHPVDDAGGYVIEGGMPTARAHRPETGKIDQVEPVVLCQDGDVISPPA